MDKYTYIIDEVVKPEKTRAIVRKMIPQLIRWAQNGQTDKTYRDMIHILNYERWSGIGRALREGTYSPPPHRGKAHRHLRKAENESLFPSPFSLSDRRRF